MDTNLVSYAYREETQFAVQPSGAYQLINYTGGNGWTPADTLTESGVVNASLMASRPAVTQRAADGGLDYELYANDPTQFLDLIPMALSADGANLAATWTVPVASTGISIEIQVTAGVATVILPTGNPVYAAVKVGQYVKLSGFTNKTNNGYFRVAEKNGGTDLVLESKGLVVEAAGNRNIKTGKMVRNGKTRHSMTVIDRRPNVQTYQSFAGQVVDAFSVTAQPNALLTGSFGTIGAGYSSSNKDLTEAGNTLGKDGAEITGTYTPSTSPIPLVTAEDIKQYSNGVDTSGFELTKGFDASISGRARGQQALGFMYNSGVGLNSLVCELNITKYFTSYALLEKYFNMAKSEGYTESLRVSDPDGNTYVFTYPRVYLSGWSLTAGSKDADMEAAFGSSKVYGYTDSTGASYAVQVDYFSAD